MTELLQQQQELEELEEEEEKEPLLLLLEKNQEGEKQQQKQRPQQQQQQQQQQLLPEKEEEEEDEEEDAEKEEEEDAEEEEEEETNKKNNNNKATTDKTKTNYYELFYFVMNLIYLPYCGFMLYNMIINPNPNNIMDDEYGWLLGFHDNNIEIKILSIIIICLCSTSGILFFYNRTIKNNNKNNKNNIAKIANANANAHAKIEQTIVPTLLLSFMFVVAFWILYMYYNKIREEYKHENLCTSTVRLDSNWRQKKTSYYFYHQWTRKCIPDNNEYVFNYGVFGNVFNYGVSIIRYIKFHIILSIICLCIDLICLMVIMMVRVRVFFVDRTATSTSAATSTSTARLLVERSFCNHRLIQRLCFQYLMFQIGFFIFYYFYTWFYVKNKLNSDIVCSSQYKLYNFSSCCNTPFVYLYDDLDDGEVDGVEEGSSYVIGCTFEDGLNEDRLYPWQLSMAIWCYFLLYFVSYWIFFHKRHHNLFVRMSPNPACRRKQQHMKKMLFYIGILVVVHVPVLFGFFTHDALLAYEYVGYNRCIPLLLCLIVVIGFYWILALLFDPTSNNLQMLYENCNSRLRNICTSLSTTTTTRSRSRTTSAAATSSTRYRIILYLLLYVIIVSTFSILLFKQESYKHGDHFYYKEFHNETCAPETCKYCFVHERFDVTHRLNDETFTIIIPMLYIGITLWSILFRIQFKPSSYKLLGISWIGVLLVENLILFLSRPAEPQIMKYRSEFKLYNSFTLRNFNFLIIFVCWNTLRQCLQVTRKVTGVFIATIALLLRINQLMYNRYRVKCEYDYDPDEIRMYNWIVIGTFIIILTILTVSSVYRKALLLWYTLRYGLTSPSKERLLNVCSQDGCAVLQYISSKTKKDYVCGDIERSLTTVTRDTTSTTDDGDYDTLYTDRDITIAACQQNGLAFKYAHPVFRSDKGIVMIACQQHGHLLELVDPKLRMDKEVVITSVTSNPDSLKYALGGLNQDPDCLVAAKLWDKERHSNYSPIDQEDENTLTVVDSTGIQNEKIIVMSTKFALSEDSQSLATKFTVLLKEHPFIRDNNFRIYSPNAYAKCTCDPEWTRKSWPCRGTYDTCKKESSLKVGVPVPASCWRYSFRYQLEQARDSNGFMIQLIELHNDNHLNNTTTSDDDDDDVEEQTPSDDPLNVNANTNNNDNDNDDDLDEDDEMIELVALNRKRKSADVDDETDIENGSSGLTLSSAAAASASASSQPAVPNEEDDVVNIQEIADEDYSFGRGQSIETEMGIDVGTKSFVVYQPTDYWLPDQVDLSHIDKVVLDIKKYYENQGGSNGSNGRLTAGIEAPATTTTTSSSNNVDSNPYPATTSRCCLTYYRNTSTDGGTQYNQRKDFFMLPNK